MRPLHIVKLGGSLITHKSGYCQLDREAVERLGRELAHALAQAAAPPLIVLGGGSFGNGIALRYGLHLGGFRQADLSRMTCGMQQLMSEVACVWRAQRIAVFPIQASAVISMRMTTLALNADPIRDALALGLVPVISGDLVLADPPRIVSSDLIPAMVARSLPVRRVSFLTDVPGLFDMSGGQPVLLRRITPTMATHATSIAGCSSVQDVTGGMKTKVAASFELLAMGVESHYVDGRVTGALRDVLCGRRHAGTRFTAPHRAARAPGLHA
jgi:isopentenyl phosphate kinase